jgi:ATP-dependent helicase/nuclease subunit B
VASPLIDRTQGTPLDPELAAALEAGVLVLTSTARAARALRRDHSEAQRERGLTAWASPSIRDWSGWIGDLWQQYELLTETPLVLTSMQEHALWLRVQQLSAQVVAPERLAELAADAYRLLGTYGAHSQRRTAAGGGWASHEDASRFAEWADSFDQLCRRNRWLSASGREEQLAAAIRAGRLQTPSEILLAGFDRVTPAQQALLDACTSRGMTMRAASPVAPATPRVVMAAHPREELDACAEWARSELARQPGRRLGILVPALGRVRAELDRVLTRVLTPRGAAPLWEFSLGSPLAKAPVVQAALLLLHWTARPLDRAEAQWLLGSGFLAPALADADALGRMTFEPSLVPGVSLDGTASRRQVPASVRAGLQAIQHFARANQFATAERSFAAWTDLAQAALGASSWPGYREASSRQFQAQQRFEHLLDELSLLAFDGSRVRWSEFLATLEMHARATLFTLETRDAPIQIMGAFEASGLRFDAVWFLGVDDGQWPATGRPHPLLPMWLQRAHGMPHAEPEADWTLGLQVSERIAASAAEVTISYAREDRGIALRPSPLIAAVFPEAVAEAVSTTVSTVRIRPAAAGLEQVEDDSGVIPWPQASPAGGADILRRQAACAFQSFAARRLQLRTDREEVLGLDAMERGSLLHKVLEHLWSPVGGDPARLHSFRLHSLDDLRQAIADESVTEMVTYHIDTVFAEVFALELGPSPATDPWSAAYIDVEKARLKRLLLEWLECEAAREPFTVAELERELSDVDLHGLRFNLRIDRIDLLEDGTRLLVDYKTSKVSAAKWSGERPDEPQLPLYYTHGGVTDVAGIAFAQLRVGDAELIARAEQPGAVLPASKSVTPLTSVEREEWAYSLTTLAGAFLRGEAQVNPKHKAKTCEYCGLQGLCRVQEVQELQAVMLDEADPD